MSRFLNLDTVGKPQFIAGTLLLVYLAQCLWLVRIEARNSSPDSDHGFRIQLGLEQWKGGAVAGTPNSMRAKSATGSPSAGLSGHLRTRDGFDQDRSPLHYLIAATPFVIRPAQWEASPWSNFIAAAPYLFFGVMLGASLWYVTRRLYGNAGGYIALLLYCFSPSMIIAVAGSQSLAEMGGVWGAFGAIWTGIAVAHTLYAPREVILWNWRRILLLGLSLAIAVGNQFSLAIFVPVALLLMLWVAPVRKQAVLVIWAASCGVAVVLLLAAYFFHPGLFWDGLKHARWIDLDLRAFGLRVSYTHIVESVFRGSPALSFVLPIVLLVYVSWKRTRYFGNSAPLIIALLLIALTVLAPQFPGAGFALVATVFLFIVVAGVFADLLETRHGPLVAAALSGLLIAAGAWNVVQLARLAKS